MKSSRIDIEQTHIRLLSDVEGHDLKRFIFGLRRDLKNHMLKNPDFAIAMESLSHEDNAPEIVQKMIDSSIKADVGPMACVAGTIAEMSLEYLIGLDSRYSVVENGGDIALVNDRKVLCGIYSGNEVLGNEIAFEIRSRRKPLGICTSSAKIGHSISFGDAQSVTVISDSPSVADALATRIANDAVGDDDEDRVSNASSAAEEFREFFDGVLIVSGEYVATVGRLPRIVETNEFKFNLK